MSGDRADPEPPDGISYMLQGRDVTGAHQAGKEACDYIEATIPSASLSFLRVVLR